MSEPELKAKMKALTRARAALPKDDRKGRAELSRDIKAAKKALNALKLEALANPTALNCSGIEISQADYIGNVSFHVEHTSGWQAFLDQRREASPYHDLKWREIFSGVMGRELKYLTARSDSGEIIGVLPIALTRSRLFGNYGVSLPYCNYGGPVSIAPNVSEALIRHAYGLTSDWGVNYLEIRDTQSHSDLDARTDKVCMKLGLENCSGIDDLLKSLSSKVRSQVKKALGSDIEFRFGANELLSDFYSVFAHHMRDLGTPVYSADLFSSIIETFPGSTYLVVGYMDGKPISCAFLLEHYNRWEIPWASTLRRAHKYNANMAMYARILQEVIERDGLEFDFGRSSKDAPTYKFKKQWGALEQQLYWYYSDPSRAQGLTTENTKFSLAIKAWQKLPVGVSKLIGPSIVRNLP